MKTVLFKAVLLNLIAVVILSCSLFAQESDKFIGIWQGKLQIQTVELRIVFHISKENEEFIVKLDSPDQGVRGIPVTEVKIEGDSFRFDIESVMGHYTGFYDNEHVQLNGTWNQMTLSLPLILNKTDEIEKPKRPQTPQPPFPYKEEEVIYENKEADITLAGTLTLPDGEGPFPAAILITGSGQQDRDETIFEHKPFWVIADYLTRRGIAVLRVDDRGIGGSTGDFSKSTTEDFASDVIAGINYLLSRKEIDNKKIGLIGHSEGGIIAPMVAAKTDNVAFIVMLAGTALTGEEILLLQSELISVASGVPPNIIERIMTINKQLYSDVKRSGDVVVAERRTRESIIRFRDELTEEEKNIPMFSEEYLNSQIKTILSPWFRYFLTYDPRPTLEKITVPILALYGEKDLQVPPKQNLTELEKIFSADPIRKYKIMELEGLNHLFQKAETGTPNEYGLIEETFSPDALKIIGDWIEEILIETD